MGEVHTGLFEGKLEVKCPLGRPGVDGNVILK
jgi:hypothetical protein